MLVDVKFASWKECKHSVLSGDKRVLFNTQNYDQLLVVNSIEYQAEYTILDTLDLVIGGCWIELMSDSKYLPGLYKHHENKGN